MKKCLTIIVCLFISTLHAQIVYVTPNGAGTKDGSSWNNALDGNSASATGYSKIADSIRLAKSGKEFWIAEGIYKPASDNNRSRFFDVKNGVGIFGGFKGTEIKKEDRTSGITIFSGDIGVQGDSSDNSYHVVRINPLGVISTDTSKLDQIVISNGFANSTASEALGAGILVNTYSKLILTSVNVNKNISAGNGGGINILPSSCVLIENSYINHNSQLIYTTSPSLPHSASGSGIYSQGKLIIKNSHVNNNLNSTTGLGIANTDSLYVYNSTIDSNLTTSYYAKAGGVYNSKYCFIKGSSLKNNIVRMSAGAIWNNSNSKMIIDSCDISNNIVDNTSNAIGGGILNDGNLNITKSLISYNNSYLDGAGVYNSSTATCLITLSKITYNFISRTWGVTGAGICNLGNLNIAQSYICNNNTSGNAGGIYNPTSVKSCIVANNKAAGSGGGIITQSTCLGVFNSTIVNNFGVGIYSGSGTVLVGNSIVYGNTTPSYGNINFFNSCVTGIYPDNNNFFDNPMFVNPSAGIGNTYNGLTADWSIKPCSPCVNKGDNSILTISDSLDIVGNHRLINSFVDVGAFEVQSIQQDDIDFSAGKVFVTDSVLIKGKGNSWNSSLSGNAPSCKYGGYTMLYQALRDAPTNCQVWLKKGNYIVALDSNRNKTFLILSKTKLYGGFAGTETLLSQRNTINNECVLNGNIGKLSDSLDNSYHVLSTFTPLTMWVDTAIIDNITIKNGYANGSGVDAGGAGLLINQNCIVKLTSCKFSYNTCAGAGNPNTPNYYGGGGIMNLGKLIMNNCNVFYNKSVILGGGIFNKSEIVLNKCIVDSNKIVFGGGSWFDVWGGGGIYNCTSSKLTIDSCEIKNNTTQNNLHGGGIYSKGNCSINHSLVKNNYSARDGGGVYTQKPIKIKNSHFTLNTTDYFGGGLSASDSLVIDSCLFDYNTAHSAPSIFTSGYGSIKNSEICNSVSSGQSGVGAGVYSSGKTSVYNCLIHSHDTKGLQFGAFIGGMFQTVYIFTGSDGAGIYHNGDTLWVDKSLFYNNFSAGGGGIAVVAGNAFIKNSKITNNFCAYGAAVLNKAKTTINNCLIANNTYYDGGLFKNAGNCTTNIVNSTIANNKRYTTQNNNAVFVHGEFQNLIANNFKISNSIIKSSTNIIGYYPGATGTDTINFSCVSGGFSGVGNINSDPMFVNQTTGNDTTYNALSADWNLSACSPCINLGADSLSKELLDINNNNRKFQRIDMGAYEYSYSYQISGLNTVCQGQDSVVYTVPQIANATSYLWILPNGFTGTSNTNSIKVSYGSSAVSGNIIVKGINTCPIDSITVSFPITVNTLPIAEAGNNQSICIGSSATLTGSSGIYYNWSNGANSQTTSVSPTTNTTYFLTVTNNNGCKNTDNVSIIVNPLPATPTIYQNGDTLISSSATGNQWYENTNGIISGATNQKYAPTQTGNYFVVVTDGNGCVSDSSNIIAFIHTGITEKKQFNNLKIYPNPATTLLTIELQDTYSSQNTVCIYNLEGKELIKIENICNKQSVNISSLPSGVYFIKVVRDQSEKLGGIFFKHKY